MSDVTRAEVCVVACAEAWRGDGEVLASPFGTIPALGARLARATFSPDLVLTDGEAALMVGAPSVSAPGRCWPAPSAPSPPSAPAWRAPRSLPTSCSPTGRLR